MSVVLIRQTLLDIESLFGDEGLTHAERERLVLKKTTKLPSRWGRKVEAFARHYLQQQKVVSSTLERIYSLLLRRGDIELDFDPRANQPAESYRRGLREAYGKFLFTVAVRRAPRGTIVAEWVEGYMVLRFYSSVDFHLFCLVEPKRREEPQDFFVTILPIEFGSERRELPIVAIVHNLTAEAFNVPVDEVITGERRRLLERFLDEEELLKEYHGLFAKPAVS